MFSAMRIGSCQGSTITPVPTRMRFVRAATQVRSCTGSGHIV